MKHRLYEPGQQRFRAIGEMLVLVSFANHDGFGNGEDLIGFLGLALVDIGNRIIGDTEFARRATHRVKRIENGNILAKEVPDLRARARLIFRASAAHRRHACILALGIDADHPTRPVDQVGNDHRCALACP